MRSHLRPLIRDLEEPLQRLAIGAIFLLLAAGVAAPRSPRILEVLVLTALLGAAGWSGWRISGVLTAGSGICSRTTCAFTLAVAAVTVGATVLGHFGNLRTRPFLSFAILLFALSLRLPPVRLPPPRLPAPLSLWSKGGVERALLLAAAAALLLRFAGSVWHVAWDPGAFLGYDDLSYHLPAVAVWNHFGDLRTLKLESGDPSTTFYPFASELFSWALLAPLGDSDVLARRVQLPFALCSLVALAAVARRLGLGRRSTLFAVLLYAAFDRAFPVLALGAGNDHATAFFALSGLDGALALLRRPGWRPAVYTGAALGLLVGTKYIGLIFAGTLAIPLIVQLLTLARSRGMRSPAGAPLGAPAVPLAGPLAALAASIFVCGGYAYVRNAWTVGNPVFPAPVELFGHPIWQGWTVASLAWRRHLPEFRIETVHFLTRRSDLFGPLFAWTLLPAALLVPVVALLRRQAGLAAVLALPWVVFLEYRYLMHDHRDVRYILLAIALAAIDLAWVVEAAGPAIGAPLRMAVLVGVLSATAAHLHVTGWQQAILLPALFAVGAGLSTGASRGCTAGPASPQLTGVQVRSRRVVVAAASATAIGILTVGGWGAAALIESFQAAKLNGDPAAVALDRATRRAGARVAYVGANQPYLFFGSRLQNDVQIVPTDADLAAQYYSWGGREHFPFDGGSFRQWRENLVARGIQFVVAARSPREGSERAWMASDPEDFQPLHQDGRTEVWSFQPAAAGKSGRSDAAAGAPSLPLHTAPSPRTP